MKVVLERLYPDPPRVAWRPWATVVIGLVLGFYITRLWVL